MSASLSASTRRGESSRDPGSSGSEAGAWFLGSWPGRWRGGASAAGRRPGPVPGGAPAGPAALGVWVSRAQGGYEGRATSALCVPKGARQVDAGARGLHPSEELLWGQGGPGALLALNQTPPAPLHRTLLFPWGPCPAAVPEHVGSRLTRSRTQRRWRVWGRRPLVGVCERQRVCPSPPPLLCRGRLGQSAWSRLLPGLGTSSPEPPGFGPHFVYTLMVRLSSDVA